MPGNLDRLDELAERGVVGFKAFMCDSGIEDFPAVDDEVLEAGMRARRRARPARRSSTPSGRPRCASRQGTTWRDFVASRPVEAELEAIEVAIELAERTGCDLHVVHVSSAEGVALVAASNATCETCPHYLTLTEDDLETLGTRAKCAPPLRPAHEVEALWRALSDDRVRRLRPLAVPAGDEGGRLHRRLGRHRRRQSMLGLLLERLPPQTGRRADHAPTSPSASTSPRAGSSRAPTPTSCSSTCASASRPSSQDRHRLSPFAGRPLPRDRPHPGPRRRVAAAA